METAKISSQRKFKSIRAAIICSRKPTKIANPQNKSPPKNFMLHGMYLSNICLTIKLVALNFLGVIVEEGAARFKELA